MPPLWSIGLGVFVACLLMWMLLDLRMKRWLASHEEDGLDTDEMFRPEREPHYDGGHQEQFGQAFIGYTRASMSRMRRYKALRSSSGICVTTLLAGAAIIGTWTGIVLLIVTVALYVIDEL